jgi:hypothetical protein
MQVDAAPPVILAASLTNVRANDNITVSVSGLADANGTVQASTVRVNVGGVMHVPFAVTPLAQAGVHAVTFSLSTAVPVGSQVPVSVGVDTRFSAPLYVSVRN